MQIRGLLPALSLHSPWAPASVPAATCTSPAPPQSSAGHGSLRLREPGPGSPYSRTASWQQRQSTEVSFLNSCTREKRKEEGGDGEKKTLWIESDP